MHLGAHVAVCDFCVWRAFVLLHDLGDETRTCGDRGDVARYKDRIPADEILEIGVCVGSEALGDGEVVVLVDGIFLGLKRSGECANDESHDNVVDVCSACQCLEAAELLDGKSRCAGGLLGDDRVLARMLAFGVRCNPLIENWPVNRNIFAALTTKHGYLLAGSSWYE